MTFTRTFWLAAHLPILGVGAQCGCRIPSSSDRPCHALAGLLREPPPRAWPPLRACPLFRLRAALSRPSNKIFPSPCSRQVGPRPPALAARSRHHRCVRQPAIVPRLPMRVIHPQARTTACCPGWPPPRLAHLCVAPAATRTGVRSASQQSRGASPSPARPALAADPAAGAALDDADVAGADACLAAACAAASVAVAPAPPVAPDAAPVASRSAPCPRDGAVVIFGPTWMVAARARVAPMHHVRPPPSLLLFLSSLPSPHLSPQTQTTGQRPLVRCFGKTAPPQRRT